MRPPRPPITTALIVGEGADEAAFTRFVLGLFNVRSKWVKFTIANADGGDPFEIVRYAAKRSYSTLFGWPDLTVARTSSRPIDALLSFIEGLIR